MVRLGDIVQYAVDTYDAWRAFPSGWSRGKRQVVDGYFPASEDGMYQTIFFRELLKIGFRKTRWQLLFADSERGLLQTAGLVRKLEEPIDGMDEQHIRFYAQRLPDGEYVGKIDIEREVGRGGFNHWRGPRKHDPGMIEAILRDELSYLPNEVKRGILKQCEILDFSDDILREPVLDRISSYRPSTEALLAIPLLGVYGVAVVADSFVSGLGHYVLSGAEMLLAGSALLVFSAVDLD